VTTPLIACSMIGDRSVDRADDHAVVTSISDV